MRRETPDIIEEVRRLRREVGDLRQTLLKRATLLETIQYTASGTFARADYPGMRAVRVRVQGGGGAGGGSLTTTAGQGSVGAGGGGGGYAEKLILAADLAASETVTVGAGGVAVTGDVGGDGGDSSFGSHCTGSGGRGGTLSTTAAIAILNAGGVGGTGTGDLVVPGTDGMGGVWFIERSGYSRGGPGGSSHLGGGRRPTASNNGNGGNGQSYGGGGAGGGNAESQGTQRIGGDGGAGIVIVEVYY